MLFKHLWCLLWLKGLAFIGQMVTSAKMVCLCCSQGHVRLCCREKVYISVSDLIQWFISCFRQNLMQVRTALWCSCLPGTQWLRDSEYSLFAFLTFQCHMTPNDTQAVKVVCECPSSWKWFGDHSLPPWCLFLCDYLCGFQKHWWDSATVKWFSEPLIYYTFNNAFCIQI